jgi:hypothetical protein
MGHHCYSLEPMQTQDEELPPEIAEIHGHIGLVNPMKAQVWRKKAQYSAKGFISTNATSFAFTQLSTMIHLSNYGVNRVLRALARGRTYESALDDCYYVGHLGEAEIPHLNSVEIFPFNELSHIKVSKDLHEYLAMFTFGGEEFGIRSEHPYIFELFNGISGQS